MDAFFVNCLNEKSKDYMNFIANFNDENQLMPVTPVGTTYDNTIDSCEYI